MEDQLLSLRKCACSILSSAGSRGSLRAFLRTLVVRMTLAGGFRDSATDHGPGSFFPIQSPSRRPLYSARFTG